MLNIYFNCYITVNVLKNAFHCPHTSLYKSHISQSFSMCVYSRSENAVWKLRVGPIRLQISLLNDILEHCLLRRSRLKWWSFGHVFRRCSFQTWITNFTTLTEISLVFKSIFRLTPGRCLKLGHDSFLRRILRVCVHYYPVFWW
jgi:hypothetical protein